MFCLCPFRIRSSWVLVLDNHYFILFSLLSTQIFTLYFAFPIKMKTAMLRSAGAALRRSAASSTPSTPSHLLRRSCYSTGAQPERKVTVLGAAGGIGQPLSLLMKLNPLVSSLSLYDIANTPGVAADVSHINSRAQVSIQFKSCGIPLLNFVFLVWIYGIWYIFFSRRFKVQSF